MTIRRVGVVGAGVIGTSLAHALVTAGLDVVVHDVCEAARDRVAPTITETERMLRLRGHRLRPRGGLVTTAAVEDVAAVDLLVESVTEDVDVKVALHSRLDQVLPASTVVAVNTSAVPITRLALATTHPERMIGAHFMNPVALSEAVEVVRTPYTSPDAMASLQALLDRLGKSAVVVEDSAGFVINRCLMLLISEAADLLDDVNVRPAEVDRLFRSCLGHRSGPLQTADLIGVDTVVRTLNVLADYYGPARFTPAPRLRRMVDLGQLGRKTGRGFYDYATAPVLPPAAGGQEEK